MEDIDTKYAVLVSGGEVVFYGRLAHVISEAKNSVFERIGSFYCHNLPIRATSDFIYNSIDIRVHEVDLSDGGGVELPYQDWCDEYYADMKKQEVLDVEYDYKRFVELREKYEQRYQDELE